MLSSDLIKGAKGAAEYLGLTPRQVFHMTEAGHLPCIRMGRTLFFRKAELEKAFTSNQQAA